VAYPAGQQRNGQGGKQAGQSFDGQCGEEAAGAVPGVRPANDQQHGGQRQELNGEEAEQADQVPAPVDDPEPHAPGEQRGPGVEGAPAHAERERERQLTGDAQRFQVQVQGGSPGAVGLVQCPGHDGRLLGGDPPAIPDRTPGGELGDGDGRPADAGRGAAQVVGGHVEHDPAPVDHHYPFEQAGYLVDQVGGQQHGPGMLGIIGEQPVVEQLAGHRVQTRVGLVEQRDLGPGGQADHDAQCGAHPAGELPDLPVQRQVEFLDQPRSSP
jgi:hypothetical protein